MRRCRFHIAPETSGCLPDITPAAQSLSFQALTTRPPMERRVLLLSRMTRFALLWLCLAPLSVGAQDLPPNTGTPGTGAPAQAPAPAPATPSTPAQPESFVTAPVPPDNTWERKDNDDDEDTDDTCPDEDEVRTEELSSVLAPLQLRVSGAPSTFASIEFKGLRHLPEPQLRELVGLPAQGQGPLTAEQVSGVLMRLARTELFAHVTPTVRLVAGAAPVLEVTLEEQPYVGAVDVRGLRDYQPNELLEELFFVSRHLTVDGTVATLSFDGHRGRLSVHWPCALPRVPREWLAHYENHTFHPGLVRGGLTDAFGRALRSLRSDGYMLASLAATLRPDGQLGVTVDEGRVESVEVVGVDPEMVPRVREALGIQPGDIFLRSDARRALKRLEARLPFLQVAKAEEQEQRTHVVEARAEDGSRTYHTEEERERPRRHRHEDLEFSVPWTWDWSTWEDTTPKGITVEDHHVVVHVRPRPPHFHAVPLPVHTQVTGFAPGIRGSLTLWDPKDRVHATLEAGFFVPLRLGGQRIPDDAEQTRRQRRLNLQGGAKLAVPSLHLVELGVQGYNAVDTFDRWRMSSFDSWFYSFLINRPDAEYFRRSGVTGFATFRVTDALYAGAEVRRDTYESLVSLTPPLSLFRRDSAPFPNPAIDDGQLQSVTGRLEYVSDAPAVEKVGSLNRTPELSLLDYERGWPARTALHSLLTLELGQAATTGTDADYWKLVSDNAFYFITGHDSGLRLRVRAAGGEHLPLQKQEALGGWTALRGYGFKEFRGTASVLGSAEYRYCDVGAFADIGTVKQTGGWTEARLGVGAVLYLGDEAHLAVAWRADEKARLTPELRLMWARPF